MVSATSAPPSALSSTGPIGEEINRVAMAMSS
jgi:hypothetical protein